MGAKSAKPAKQPTVEFSYEGTKITNNCDEVIWVKVDAERERINMDKLNAAVGAGVTAGNIGVNVSGSVDRERHSTWNEITTGFSQIKPGKYLNLDVDLGRRETVYVSVVTASGEVLLDACPKKADKCFEVTEDRVVYSRRPVRDFDGH